MPAAAFPPAPPAYDAQTPLVIVLNTGSGNHDAAAREAAIRDSLQQAGRAHELLRIVRGTSVQAVATQAVARARERNGAVVAAGGDGTLNAVARAVLPTGLPFGVLPQGTFNYFGRAHGIPTDTTQATRALLRATPRPVQVGLVNGHGFLVNASVGLYPQLLEDREAYKQRYGRSRLVALWSACVTLLHAHRPLRLFIGEPGAEIAIRTPTLFVANNPLQLQQIGIGGGELLSQGRLVAITLQPLGTLALLRLMLQGALGRLGEAREVHSASFARLRVRPAAPRRRARIKVATDGEIHRMQAPLEFTVSPQPLWLLAPAPEDAVTPE